MNLQICIIRRWLSFFMIALLLSGLTAIPAETELNFLERLLPAETAAGSWLSKVAAGLRETNFKFPFLAYGYDWLAFAHIVLSLLFIGPYRDPVRNKWVIRFGQYCCLMIIPFAFLMGIVREIPLGWTLIDCSFGIVGLVPLTIVYRKIESLELQRSLVTAMV